MIVGAADETFLVLTFSVVDSSSPRVCGKTLVHPS